MTIDRTHYNTLQDNSSPTAQDGSVWDKEDVNQILLAIDALIGESTAYIPVWTTTGTAPTLGNATLTGRYARHNKLVFFEINFVFGSTSAVGSGSFRFSLPSTAADTQFGAYSARVLGSGQWFVCTGYLSTATTVSVLNNGNTGSGIGAGVPFAWATGNNVAVSGFYVEP